MMECPYHDRKWREGPTLIRPLELFKLSGDMLAALECIGGKDGLCDYHPDYWVHEYHFVHPYLVCKEHLEYHIRVKKND